MYLCIACGMVWCAWFGGSAGPGARVRVARGACAAAARPRGTGGGGVPRPPCAAGRLGVGASARRAMTDYIPIPPSTIYIYISTTSAMRHLGLCLECWCAWFGGSV